MPEDLKREECCGKCKYPKNEQLVTLVYRHNDSCPCHSAPKKECKGTMQNCPRGKHSWWCNGCFDRCPDCYSAPKGCCAIDIFGQHEINCPKFGTPLESPNYDEEFNLRFKQNERLKGMKLKLAPQPWEEAYEKLIDSVSQSTDFDNVEYPKTRKDIKSFIKNLLLSAREEGYKVGIQVPKETFKKAMLEALPKKKDYLEGNTEWADGYNQCLAEVIKIIKGETP